MQAIIDVFRMNEVSPETRAKIIIQLGVAINHQHGMNITELLVFELVKQLEPDNEVIKNDHFTYFLNKEKTKS